ncbi:hypothetical protein AOA59_26400 [Pseudomonas sp. 2822-15]|nr:hypothetical protein AOA59_26400 [Pseudomonas sp. 2822-15]
MRMQCSNQMWELSSPSEAAKAAAQARYKLPDPPLSQPRWGSTAPTGDRLCCLDLSPQGHRAIHKSPQQQRSNVGAVEPQRGCEGGGTGEI